MALIRTSLLFIFVIFSLVESNISIIELPSASSESSRRSEHNLELLSLSVVKLMNFTYVPDWKWGSWCKAHKLYFLCYDLCELPSQNISSVLLKPMMWPTLSLMRDRASENEIITQSGLFENKVGPGVAQSKVYSLSFCSKLSVSSMPRKSQHVKFFPSK